MEVKPGLESSDKTLFSGIKISPIKLNLKHKFKNKRGMDNYLLAVVYTEASTPSNWLRFHEL